MSVAPADISGRAAAPIERVAIPLRPRTPAGCCDLAVMFYGRHVGPALRLWLAAALPAVALVYGLSRFAGTDLAVAAIAAVIVSKQLGMLTVAATVRTTFGEPFERPKRDERERRTRAGRLREVTRSMVTAAAALAAGVLVAATLDDAYGTGRLAAAGPETAAVTVSIAAAVLFVRAQMFLAERHTPTAAVRNGVLLGTMSRVLLAVPLALLLFEETWGWGVGVAALWLPLAATIAMRRSFGAERRALAEIDPALHTRQADAALSFGEMSGPAFTVAAAAAGLAFVVFAGIEFALRIAGFASPLSGPLGDTLDFEFFDAGLVFSSLGRSPLFAATALAAGLFAYQLGRIAWYFAYLDARVRRDCWDMELMLAREAKRLEGE